jgi:hypothetical protein
MGQISPDGMRFNPEPNSGDTLTPVTPGATDRYFALPLVLPDTDMAADTLGMQSNQIVFVSFFRAEPLRFFKARETLGGMAFPTMGIDTHGSEFKVMMAPYTSDSVLQNMFFMRKSDGSRIDPDWFDMREPILEDVRRIILRGCIHTDQQNDDERQSKPKVTF